MEANILAAVSLLAAADMDIFGIATALVIGCFVCMLSIALMGQRGRVGISPEREIALAAGQADRKTLFESAAFGPLMWLLLVFGRYLRMTALKRWLHKTLIAAGSPNFYTADEYIALSLMWGITLAVVLQVFNLLLFGMPPFVFIPIGFASGFCGMLYHIHDKAEKRLREIARRVPYSLDLISLAMGAGATFTEAVRTVVKEDPDHPFNVELNTVLAEAELGTTRQQALRSLADRVPLESLRAIIASVVQAEGLGTPLADVLKEQANLMRLQRSVRAEKLAASASVRILLPGVVILISVVLTIMAPFIIRGVRGELW